MDYRIGMNSLEEYHYNFMKIDQWDHHRVMSITDLVGGQNGRGGVPFLKRADKLECRK